MNGIIATCVEKGETMSDYIKREDALELFEMVLDSYKDSGIQNIKTMVAIAPQEFHLSEDNEIADFNFELDGWRNSLMEIESADVAPVRHGRWDVREPMPMHDIKGNLSWGNWYVCTGCGFATTAIEGHITQYKYCPSCGARMDGDENE